MIAAFFFFLRIELEYINICMGIVLLILFVKVDYQRILNTMKDDLNIS